MQHHQDRLAPDISQPGDVSSAVDGRCPEDGWVGADVGAEDGLEVAWGVVAREELVPAFALGADEDGLGGVGFEEGAKLGEDLNRRRNVSYGAKRGCKPTPQHTHIVKVRILVRRPMVNGELVSLRDPQPDIKSTNSSFQLRSQRVRTLSIVLLALREAATDDREGVVRGGDGEIRDQPVVRETAHPVGVARFAQPTYGRCDAPGTLCVDYAELDEHDGGGENRAHDDRCK